MKGTRIKKRARERSQPPQLIIFLVSFFLFLESPPCISLHSLVSPSSMIKGKSNVISSFLFFDPPLTGWGGGGGEKKGREEKKGGSFVSSAVLSRVQIRTLLLLFESSGHGGGKGDCQLVARSLQRQLSFHDSFFFFFFFYLFPQCGCAYVQHDVTGDGAGIEGERRRRERKKEGKKKKEKEIKRVGAAFMRSSIHRGKLGQAL